MVQRARCFIYFLLPSVIELTNSFMLVLRLYYFLLTPTTTSVTILSYRDHSYLSRLKKFSSITYCLMIDFWSKSRFFIVMEKDSTCIEIPSYQTNAPNFKSNEINVVSVFFKLLSLFVCPTTGATNCQSYLSLVSIHILIINLKTILILV